MSRTLSNTKRRPGQHGDFGKETPPLTGTTANIHMWLAAWHIDHGHSVADTDQFVDTLRKLDWTATKLRNLSVEKLIEDLHTCDYKFDWAPRLAGDIKRAINLKDFNTFSEVKTPFRDLPDLIILPNRHFIDNTPPATATTSEVRDWLKLWFDHRPDDQEFKLFTTRFEYQCPLSLIDELQWDGIDIVFFTQPDLKKTILGKFLRGAHNNALAADIREGRKKMRKDLAKGELKRLKTQFSRRSSSSA